MRCVGIVAEYNPFHTGHAYHIAKARIETKADGVVVIMSGSFVQRGEPAIYDKWTRTRHAIEGGADLVLELPAVYALASAEGFAFGAVETLRKTGVVCALSFGSECGDLSLLTRAANILRTQPPVFLDALHEALRAGKTYASARAEALALLDGDAAACLKQPNNMLGIAYLCALLQDTTILPHTVRRAGSAYGSETVKGQYASALSLRQALCRGERCDGYLPYPTETLCVHHWGMYEKALVYALKVNDPATWQTIPRVIRNRIFSCQKQTAEEIWQDVKTRNVTMAMVKRALCRILICDTLPDTTPPAYIRVLGFGKRGAEILHHMKKTASLPIIVKPAKYLSDTPIWETEKRATDVYFMYDSIRKTDLSQSPVHLL